MKHRTAVTIALAVAGLGGLAASGLPARAEDDLAIVKKAVASPAPARAVRSRRVATVAAAPAAERVESAAAVAQAAPAAAPEPRPRARSREPQWFKVRVVDKVTGRKKVTVNLPLSLVRALGDDTIDWGCHGGGERERCHTVRLSEVLRSLEAGQELVEIEDEEATVKVWVE
jgi:hypothetical protein